MSDNNLLFMEKIKSNLDKNGFPEKAVSFPLESLYEKAHNAGANLNKVLELLFEEGVINEKTTEKIVFSKKSLINDDILEGFKDLDMDDVRKKSERMMKDMPPEQLEQAKKMFENMSEAERQNLMAEAMKMFGKK